MNKRKKSIIITFSILFFVTIMFTSILANAEDTDEKLCTTEARIYFFMLGSSYKRGQGSDTSTTTFSDELPEGAEIQRVTANPGNMTESDFEIYRSMVKGEIGSCSGTGANGAPICEYENYRTNSGNDTSYSGKYEGNYWNEHIVQPDNVNINCNPAEDGMVSCTITRTWDDNDTSQYIGEGHYSVPAKANIVIEYIAEDCGDDSEEEDNACDSSERGINLSQGNCGTTSYEGVKTVNFSLNREINEGDSDYYNHKSTNPVYSDKGNGTEESCPTTIKQTLTGSANIEQIGQATITSTPYSIYAGGGFTFDVNYIGRAKYDLCEQINYTTSEQYADYYCPPSENVGSSQITYTPVGTNGRQCQKTITTTNEQYITEEEYEANIEYYDSYCSSISYYGSYIKCTTITTSNGGTQPAEFRCATAQTASGTCTYSNGSLSCNGCDGQGELNTIAEEMAQYLEEPSSEDYTLTARDSNDANNSNTTVSWYDWNITSSIPSLWLPDTYATYNVDLSQKRACIDRYTANIRYTDTTCDEETEIDGETLYYVPLKYFGSEFKIGVSLSEISIVNFMDWSLNANCGPSCYQKIYKENGGYKFIYRPIDMTNPFPNRSEGSNWITFMNDYNANANNAKNKLTRNQLEYHSYLTPEMISSINSYNNYKYPDLRSVTYQGKSSALSRFGIQNLEQNNYNKLGECSETTTGDKKCWSTDQGISGW